MADPQSSTASQGTGPTIPPETQEKFGALIELIKGSESMNQEERQYWINILPAMTPDQVTNLEQILTNEREQLAAIDAKYAKAPVADVALMEKKIRDQKSKRTEREREQEAKEQAEEAALLERIDAL